MIRNAESHLEYAESALEEADKRSQYPEVSNANSRRAMAHIQMAGVLINKQLADATIAFQAAMKPLAGE